MPFKFRAQIKKLRARSEERKASEKKVGSKGKRDRERRTLSDLFNLNLLFQTSSNKRERRKTKKFKSSSGRAEETEE